MVAIHPYPSTNMEERYQPAYPGAKFDKCGYCLVHPMVRLCKPNHDIDNVEGSGLGVDSRRADSTNRRQTFPMSSKSLAREPSRMMHSRKNMKEGKNKRNNSDRGYTIITKFCPMCNSSGDSMFPTPEPKASSNRKKQQKTRKQTSSSAEIDIPVPTIVSCERKSSSSGNREDHNNDKGSDSTRWSSRLSTRGNGNDILLNRNPSDSQTIRSQTRPMNEEMEIVVSKMHKMSIESIHPDRKHQADDLRRASDKSAGEKVEDSDKLLMSSKNHNDDKVTSTALRKGSEVKISRDEHRLRRNRNSLPSMSHQHQSKSIGKSVPERWSSSEHTVRRSNDANDFRRWNSSDVNIIHESELSNPRRFQSIDGALNDSDRCNSTNKELIVFDKETSESSNNVSRSRSSNSTSPAQNRVHALRRTGSQRWQHGQHVSQSPPHKKGGSMRETETLKKSGTSKSTSKRRTRRVDGSSNALISLNTTPVASRRRSESIPQDEPTQNELEEKYRFLHSKNKRDEFSSSMPHIHRIGNETELFATSRKMQRSTQLNDVISNDVVVWNKTPIRRSRSQGMSRASQKQRSDQNKEFRRSRSGCKEFSSSMPQLREGVNGSYASTATRERNERQYFNCLSEDIVDRITDLKAKSSRYNCDGRLKEDAVSASDPPCTEGFQTSNKSLERLQDEMDRERNKTILSMKPRPTSNSGRRRSLSFDGADSITSKSISDYEKMMSSSMPPIHLKGNAIETLASSGQSMSYAQHQDQPIQPKVFRRSRSGWEELSSSMPHLHEHTNERFPVSRTSRKSTQHQYDRMLSSSSRVQPSKFCSESRSKKPVLQHDDETNYSRPTSKRRRSYTIRDKAASVTSKIRSRSASALPSRKRVSFDLSTDSPEWLVQRQCRYLQRFYRNIHHMSLSSSSAERISRERENEEIIGNLIDLQGGMMKNRNQGSSISNDDEAVSTGRIQDDTSVTHSECTTRQRGSRNYFGVREI